MSSVQTIEVHTAPAYEVTIGAGLLRVQRAVSESFG